ncbi:MAG: MFS transporter [Gammaproteobacteria bacterium]|jgi:fucose permease
MKRSLIVVWFTILSFCVISFQTNILGPLAPDVKSGFHLSLALTGLLPFSFFIAYGVMSIPAGYLTETFNQKIVALCAFILIIFGTFLFVLYPNFVDFAFSLFIVGAGMAMLQVVINPLLRTAGGEEKYSFYLVLAQLLAGLASFISPFVYSYFVLHPNVFAHLVPAKLPWISVYWICGFIAIGMLLLVTLIKFPKAETADVEAMEGFNTILDLFTDPVVIMFFFGIFAYVGTEQGISVWISKFLSTYHGINPHTVGARDVAMFWGIMTAGGLLGLVLLKLIDVQIVLASFIICALVTLSLALFGSAKVALIAFPMCGFFLSVMYPGVYSLGLNSVAKHHNSVAGIFCTAIIGGAVIAFLVGYLGDLFGLRVGMMLNFITLLYMLYIAIFAHPLVRNETIFNRS